MGLCSIIEKQFASDNQLGVTLDHRHPKSTLGFMPVIDWRSLQANILACSSPVVTLYARWIPTVTLPPTAATKRPRV